MTKRQLKRVVESVINERKTIKEKYPNLPDFIYKIIEDTGIREEIHSIIEKPNYIYIQLISIDLGRDDFKTLISIPNFKSMRDDSGTPKLIFKK